MKKMFLHSLTAMRAAALVSLSVLTLSSARADEFRGVTVDAFGSGFLNSNEVSKLVADCRTYNFNAVIVQMRRRGDAFYMPQAPNAEPRTTALAANFDALQEIINQCHNSSPRIEVHCWAPANLVWSDSTKAPTQPGHVFNIHPEYLTRSAAGGTFFAEGYFLDPGNPAAMQWNYNMAKDIVSRYDVDGFHWDYIRYPQQDSGYNAVAIARYNAEFGLTGQPASNNSQFASWRRRQITDFLRWVNADLWAVKPSLVISASVFANRTDAYSYRFQDWAAWNNEGVLDICVPMNYTADNAIFTSRADDAFNNQGVRWCYVSPGAYLNTKENTLVQLNYLRNKPFRGTTLYSYRSCNSGTINQADTFQFIRDNYQPSWEATPALPWIANPTKGIVKGTVVRADNGAAIYNATVTVAGRTQKTGPNGKYALYEVEPGDLTVTASAGGVGSAPADVTVTAGGIFTVDLAVALPPIPDNTVPSISAVNVGTITSNSVVVTWVTDEAADSTVEYGPTTAYGATQANASLVYNHTVALAGLAPAATYNFRVKSKDASGNEGVSGNFTFTTAPATVDVIVDNTVATVSGAWSTATGAADKYGADYRYRTQGTGANHVTFTPNLPVAGNYMVYEWHPAGSNRATNTPHIVTSAAGTQTIPVNQQVNGGKWNFIGTFNFNAGTGGSVRISDAASSTNTSQIMADAIKFTYLPDGPVSDIILDNPAAVLTGAWSSAASATDKYGTNYHYRTQGTGANYLTYTPGIVVPGDYQVFEWHPAGSNRATNTPYIVSHNGGITTNFVNQKVNGGKWNLIGAYKFNAGTAGFIRISDAAKDVSTSQIMADAVKLVYVAPAAPPAAPSGLAAAAISTSQINVSWTDNSTDETSFIIGRAANADGPYADIATLPANTVVYADGGLSAGTAYFYSVRAANAGGASATASGVGAVTLPNAPVAPSGLSAVAISASQIDLAWTDNDGGVDNYFVVARATAAQGPFADIAVLPAKSIAFSDAGLPGDTSFFYTVRAVNSGGASEDSNVASATTLSDIPAAPGGLEITVTGATELQLSWTDNASNEEAFVVSRTAVLGQPLTPVATLPANTTTFADTGLAPHTLYFYSVKAVNAGGSAESGLASAATLNRAPQAVAGTDITVNAGNDCQATVTLDGAASNDPDGDSLEFVWNSALGVVGGAAPTVTLPLGTTVFTLTVDDGFGGTDSAEITVTVVDATAPALTLNGDSVITLECRQSDYVEVGASAIDACAGDLTSDIQIAGTVDTETPGVYVLTYAVADASGNSASVTRTVNVVDTTPPQIAVPADIAAEAASPEGAVVTFAVTAEDLMDGAVAVTSDPPSGSLFPFGTTTVTVAATDAAGNTAVAAFAVTVADTMPPVIEAVENLVLEYNNSAGVVATFEPFASDIVSGPVAVTANPLSGSIFPLGTTVVTLTATDAAGNTGTATFNITVVDTTAPVIFAPNNLVAEASGASGAYVEFAATALDLADGDVEVLASPASGSLFPFGTTTVTLTATDAAGNTSTTTFTVTVVDTTAPVIGSLAADPSVLWPANHKMVPVTLTAVVGDVVDAAPATKIIGVTSNQPIEGPGNGKKDADWEITGDLTLNLRAERTAKLGSRTYTVTVQSTDAAGNSATASVNIVVPHSAPR